MFWDAPRVTLYGWRYVLVKAGPDQATSWRPSEGWAPNWKHTELPDLMFPEDRSWLISTLWDDFWMCIGGSSDLIRDLFSNPVLASRARQITVEEPATPAGLDAG